jgi:membrane-associated phospholipid phosphatase
LQRSHSRFALSPFNWGIPASLLALAALSLLVDLPVARSCSPANIPRFVFDVVDQLELFGHGVGATLIVITVAAVDRMRRPLTGWLLVCSLGAGLAANLIKSIICRHRPREIDLSTITSIQETFGPILAYWAPKAMGHSFPSAHTAVGFGLAVGLTRLYPQAAWYWFTLAALVGLQRVVSSAHYPSDVFAGACVGWLFASFVVSLIRQPSDTAVPWH